MSNKNSKVAIFIAILFEIILIYTATLNVISKEWKDLYQTGLAVICIIIPFILTKIANRKKLLLPSNFQTVSVIFIVLSLYFGEIKKFYEMFWWWDLFLHGTFGIYASIVGVYIALNVFVKKSDITKRRFAIVVTIFALCFAITLGTLWEIFEFIGDYFLKTNMMDNGLEDTMTDLIVKTLGALITSIICSYRKLRN